MMLKLVGKLGPREKPTGVQPKQADDDMVELEKRRQYSGLLVLHSIPYVLA